MALTLRVTLYQGTGGKDLFDRESSEGNEAGGYVAWTERSPRVRECDKMTWMVHEALAAVQDHGAVRMVDELGSDGGSVGVSGGVERWQHVMLTMKNKIQQIGPLSDY